MIQDIYPHILDNQFKEGKRPKADSPVLHFKDRTLLLRKTGDTYTFPLYAELFGRQAASAMAMSVNGRMSNTNDSVIYLLTLDNTDYFFACGDEVPVPADCDYVPSIRTVIVEKSFPKEQQFLIMTAWHLANWYSNNRYCGHCGSRMVIARTERAIKCPACRNRVYPVLHPAVIVAVRNQNQLLMTKYAGTDAVPYYALIAGFAEVGETIEETVRREVKEEVGLEVTNLTYYKSQPWAVAEDLLFGFFCDVSGDPTIRMDQKELKEAVWMDREDIQGQPNDFSLTHEMMMVFAGGEDPDSVSVKA